MFTFGFAVIHMFFFRSFMLNCRNWEDLMSSCMETIIFLMELKFVTHDSNICVSWCNYWSTHLV